ncbi:MAG: hypothetical protein LBK99_17810 [Opitutaceae bacterium]|jgi:hypothetical protein|nr:hypothetical protein [Opitutaceae bacterium]
MPTNLPQPSSSELMTWLLCAAAVVGFGIYIWEKIRTPPKTEIAQPLDVRFTKEFASKRSVDALFAGLRDLRQEFERKMGEQRQELMDALDKNREEQREDNRQMFDLLRALSAESKATSALVEQINRRLGS